MSFRHSILRKTHEPEHDYGVILKLNITDPNFLIFNIEDNLNQQKYKSVLEHEVFYLSDRIF